MQNLPRHSGVKNDEVRSEGGKLIFNVWDYPPRLQVSKKKTGECFIASAHETADDAMAANERIERKSSIVHFPQQIMSPPITPITRNDT